MGDRHSLLRNRDFALVLVGGTVNNIGDWMLEIALPVYVYLATGSGLATAAVYVIELVAGVTLGPIGGSLADRWSLRPTLVITSVMQAITLLPLLAVESHRVWPVYLVSALQGVIRQVNDPASFAMFPRLVDDDQLVRANALASSGSSLARLIGSPIGGIAVATGGLGAVVAADAATFAISAITTAMISLRGDHVAAGSSDASSRDTSVRSGLREVRARPPVAALVGIQALARVAFAAFPVLFIAFVANYLDGGGTEVGIIRAGAAFGGIAAALTISGVARRFNPAAVMVVGFLAFGVIGLGFVNAPSFTTDLWAYVVLFGLTGFPNITAQVGMQSTAQELCPPAMLGRLSGLMSATGALGAGVGSIGAGLLLNVFSARTLFNGQVTIYTVCGVLAYVFVLRPTRPDRSTPD
jgi:MFS family permease